MSVKVTRKNPGWLRSLIGEYRTIAGKEIACGFPKGTAQAYPDGEQVATVAAQHVFGIGVPQRDFMTYSAPDVEKKSKPLLEKIVKLTNRGETQAVPALMEGAGLAGAAAIKNGIVDGEYTPNSLATIAAKGSDKPLIDTGHMVQSVTYAIRDKRG